MRIRSIAMLAALSAIPIAGARADGLIYRLPKDGTSIEFKLTGSFERNDETKEFDGTLLMSSVGKETVDGEACRWIEFKMVMTQDGNERTVIAKVLVPEKQLAAGKSPASHVKKTWYKPEGADAKELADLSNRSAGPLPAFLAGPFADAKTLKAKTIDSRLGKLDCKGVTGSTQFKLGSQDQKYSFTSRLNDKAPFGVVACELKIEITQNGQQQGTGTLTFKAAKVGKDAVTGIPNTN